MIFYCKHYKDQIKKGKAMKYCLKTNCWALKIFNSLKQAQRICKTKNKK